jgi:hypothetical protein
MTSEMLLQSDFSTTEKTTLFEKRIVADLSEAEMLGIDGGTTPLCVAGAAVYAGAVASSGWCIGGAIVVGSFVGGVIYGYTHPQ